MGLPKITGTWLFFFIQAQFIRRAKVSISQTFAYLSNTYPFSYKSTTGDIAFPDNDQEINGFVMFYNMYI